MRPGTLRARVNVKIAIFSIKRQTRSMNETPRPGRPLADMRPGPRVTHRLWLFEEDLSPLNISRGATKSQRTCLPHAGHDSVPPRSRPVDGALVTAALASSASVGGRLACLLTAAADQSTLMAEKILKTNQ